MSATVSEVCRQAREASVVLRELDTSVKDRVLRQIAAAVDAAGEELKAANALDLDAAAASGVSATLLDRLRLTDSRIAGMVKAINTIADLPDPVGQVAGGNVRPNGLLVEQVREPLGVVAVVYEARPNVTADVAALCLKSGNAAVLRGSSIAAHTNAAIADVIAGALRGQDEVPQHAVQLIRDTSREAVLELLRAKGDVDLLVPRGGPGLIKTVEDHATVPTVIDGDGNCHVYVDATADLGMATDIVVNAKTSRPSVCNAAETLLVHADLAEVWLPKVLDELDRLGVEIRGDARTREFWPKAEPVQDSDWGTEYLDLVLAVKVVSDFDEALAHINRWGTRNAEAIVARDVDVVRRFARAIDSGSVFVNTSTRFSDGGEFGYGVEIGVSTQKLHARGPMGLESLTCVKNVVWGRGQIRIL
ncbi:glutamate-5-semialdehyde dehydrogenase [Streptomyces sp. NPDC057908]|uniref:glutamate-5-semialdehyde dehydrogenase n=1 Tax=unclassified Streptomyces TaxID=2593676 RepID=UPI002E10E4C4|nr:glutamate-5-semialdehyde dehydrogenase [Streptomyces sp. NBC_01224]